MVSPYKVGGSFRVTSPVGWRTDPFGSGKTIPHYGLDCVGTGNKYICAVRDGTVVRSRLDVSWGNYVAINDDDGYTIYYCHMQERMVAVGDRVNAGDVIGVEGATGAVTGRHLHIEKRHGTRKCDQDAPDGDDCNIAAALGITNAVGVYELTSNLKEETVLDNTPAEWSEEAVKWAVEHEILYGDEDGNYKLRDACTREQMLVFLHRLYKLLSEA